MLHLMARPVPTTKVNKEQTRRNKAKRWKIRKKNYTCKDTRNYKKLLTKDGGRSRRKIDHAIQILEAKRNGA